MKMNFGKVGKVFANNIDKIGRFVQTNAPTILTVMAIGGTVTTVVLAVKATPKALELIEEEEAEKPLEIVQACWKQYVPAAIAGTSTIACIIGANTINLKRQAALLSVITMSESALREYKDKVKELCGEETADKVRDEVNKSRCTDLVPVEKDISWTGKGDALCYDAVTGRYFRSSAAALTRAGAEINKRLYTGVDGFATLNDFYYEIGLDGTKYGDMIGWNTDTCCEPVFTSTLKSDGTPCLVLDFKEVPFLFEHQGNGYIMV